MAQKREWALLVGVVVVTLVTSLVVIRWMAPELLGRPADLTLVKASKEVPPFFDGIIRREDYGSRDFLLNDPVTVVRGRPKVADMLSMGPHDHLGFRNRSVPAVAHVVAIGDSQTYGNNAFLEDNWPSRLESRLADRFARVYGMAIGGWGAIQYLDMFTKVTAFEPRVVVVAFYTGNDSLESFKVAYGSGQWADLRVDPALSAGDVPHVEFPSPPEQHWAVEFAGGVRTVFTPALRLAVNQDHPAVNAGYTIMAEVAQQIGVIAAPFGIRLVFTVIPTKELAYAPKVASEGIEAPPEYSELVSREAEHVAGLRTAFASIPNAAYADVLGALQEAALAGEVLYPANENGHPLASGYDVIAGAVEGVVRKLLPETPEGLVLYRGQGGADALMLIRDGVARRFGSPAIAQANGWDLNQVVVPTVTSGLAAGLAWAPSIQVADPGRFGPLRGAVSRSAGP